MDKKRICIIGLGGVGGLIGARLAAHYGRSDGADVFFLARGNTLQSIKENGILLYDGMREISGRPKLVTDDASKIGVVDYMIFAVKTYDLAAAADAAAPCVGKNTVIFPFLNGVDGVEVLRGRFKGALVPDASVFVVSKISSPGVISCETGRHLYVFGSAEKSVRERLEPFVSLLTAAGVNAKCVSDIKKVVWEKFAFISPLATLTSYLDRTFGQINSNPQDKAALKLLLEEFCAVAKADGTGVSDGLVAETLTKFDAIMPADATTSMQRDFQEPGKATELESLTGYIVRRAEALKINTPLYKRLYQALKDRRTQA